MDENTQPLDHRLRDVGKTVLSRDLKEDDGNSQVSEEVGCAKGSAAHRG